MIEIRDGLGIRANVTIEGFEAQTGRQVSVQHGHNLVVAVGRNLLRDFLNDDMNISGITDFALGSSATAAASTDVALGSETLRNAITQTVKSPSALQLKYFLSSTQLNGTTIREAGLFSDTTLFARYILSPEIVKTSALVFTFSWVITFSSV